MEASKRSCFISYPYGKDEVKEIIRNVVEPVLDKLGWKAITPDTIQIGASIFDWMARSIRDSDLFICDISGANVNVLYELGMAHGWGKRTILLSQDMELIPFDVASRYPVLIYSTDEIGVSRLNDRLIRSIEMIEEKSISLRDPALDRLIDEETSISIEVLKKDINPVDAIRYIDRVIYTFHRLSSLSQASFIEFRIGSLGTWISTNIEGIAKLAEKIVFFIPELKIKNAMKIKIEAEAELLRAQAEKARAEAHNIYRENYRQDLKLFQEILAQHSSVGARRITIGNKLSIERTEDGSIYISLPRQMRKR